MEFQKQECCVSTKSALTCLLKTATGKKPKLVGPDLIT